MNAGDHVLWGRRYVEYVRDGCAVGRNDRCVHKDPVTIRFAKRRRDGTFDQEFSLTACAPRSQLTSLSFDEAEAAGLDGTGRT